MKMFTLITGASAGIGKALALECASRKMNLLLAALPGLELEDTVREIKTAYKIECHAFGVDLSKPESFCLVYKWIKDIIFT
jgi:short-subunit dehydrogenase